MSANKFKQLTKKTAKLTVTALVVIGCFGGLYAGVMIFSNSVETQKAEAEKKRGEDEGQLTNFNSQMEKSTVAEKRFAALQESRTSNDYAINRDTFADALRVWRAKYNLDSMNLGPSTEIETDKKDLQNLPYSITLRPRIKINYRAVSDVHAFSFIDEMVNGSGGFMRVDHLELRRKVDMDESVLKQLRDGSLMILVEAKMEVTNIGISKVDKKAAKPAGASGAPGTPAASPAPITPGTP